MIVVDVNVLLYLVLNGDATSAARDVLQKDSNWRAPMLWRSEMLNALAGYIRRGQLDVPIAAAAFEKASRVVRSEPVPSPLRILELVSTSKCTAYDCEYVAAAELLRAQLVTNDRQIIREFSSIAMSMADFLNQ